MKSEFRYHAYLMAWGCILFPTALTLAGLVELQESDVSIWVLLIICPSFLLIWIWTFLGELRTKVISVKIEEDKIVVKRYLCLGIAKTYPIDEISGFKTSILYSKGGSYEYLYLMIDKKKIAKLSAFYHSNYKELKRYLISANVRNLGVERFSNRQELKDIFS